MAARFPHARARCVPHLPKVVGDAPLHRDVVGRDLDTGTAREIEAVEYLAVDVDLVLLRRRVADQHGLCAAIARQLRYLVFVEVPATVEPIHDLHSVGRAADRPQQPVAPSRRLLGEASVEEGAEREGGVAQPAVAIVPVHVAAGEFRQASGGRRHEAAREVVHHGLESDQRALHDVRPARLRCVEAADPIAPVLSGVEERRLCIDVGVPSERCHVRRCRVHPRRIGEDEAQALTFPDSEGGGRHVVVELHRHGRVQAHLVGADPGGDAALGRLAPGRHRAVGEA